MCLDQPPVPSLATVLMNIPTIPFIIALLLSVHGWRKRSLSADGAVTAFVVGILMMAGGTRVFGVALIGFYLAGSRATKCECFKLAVKEMRLINGRTK